MYKEKCAAADCSSGVIEQNSAYRFSDDSHTSKHLRVVRCGLVAVVGEHAGYDVSAECTNPLSPARSGPVITQQLDE